MHIRRLLVGMAVVAGFAGATFGDDAAAPRVEQFTPQGTVLQIDAFA